MQPNIEHDEDTIDSKGQPAIIDNSVLYITISGVTADADTPMVLINARNCCVKATISRYSNRNPNFEFEFDYDGEIYLFSKPELISLGSYYLTIKAYALKDIYKQSQEKN
jgi:hypothetical protein